MDNAERIIQLITTRGRANQQAFQYCREFFEMIKAELKETERFLKSVIAPVDAGITIEYEDKGRTEVRFRFANDVLIFFMHTTIVTFDSQHAVLKSTYIKEQPMRALCGMIYVYNFLNDTLKYNRMEDAGELIARIFVNSENHFLMEGKRQLGILYNSLASQEPTPQTIKNLIEQLIIHVLEIDPAVHPFDSKTFTTLREIIDASTPAGLVTGKRFGFVIPGKDESA